MTQEDFKKSKKRAIGKKLVNIFFRSTTNGWSTENQFSEYADNCYICRDVPVPAGNIEFKIADDRYNDINCGGTILTSHRYKTLTNHTNNNAIYLSNKKDIVDIYLNKVEDEYQVMFR